MSVKTRKQKINKIAKQARQIFDNRKGRIAYRVDSLTDGRPLQVVTEVYRNGVLQAKVSQYDYAHKRQYNERGNHKADFSKYVCYQALDSLKARAKSAGKVLSLCDNYKSAKRLLNFGGELIKISNLGNGVVWGTLR